MRSKKETILNPSPEPINITVQEVNQIFGKLNEIMKYSPIERGEIENTTAFDYHSANFRVYAIPGNDKFLVKVVFVHNSYGNESDIPDSITLVKPVEKVVTSFEEIN